MMPILFKEEDTCGPSSHDSPASQVLLEDCAPFGVFHVVLGRGDAAGLRTASVLHLCLVLSDSTVLADGSLAHATA